MKERWTNERTNHHQHDDDDQLNLTHFCVNKNNSNNEIVCLFYILSQEIIRRGQFWIEWFRWGAVNSIFSTRNGNALTWNMVWALIVQSTKYNNIIIVQQHHHHRHHHFEQNLLLSNFRHHHYLNINSNNVNGQNFYLISHAWLIRMTLVRADK